MNKYGTHPPVDNGHSIFTMLVASVCIGYSTLCTHTKARSVSKASTNKGGISVTTVVDFMARRVKFKRLLNSNEPPKRIFYIL